MQYKQDNFTNGYLFEIIWVVIIGIFGRLIPHIPNITPVLGLCLFAGANLPHRISFLIVTITMIFSDICLALVFGYPIFSYFTLFTYTGFAAVILISAKGVRSQKAGSLFLSGQRLSSLLLSLYILGTSCVFWMWTNFGVWLTSGLYTKSLNGLVTCYYMAMPFLRNSIIGDVIWSYLIFGVFYILLEKKIITRVGLLHAPQFISTRE